MSEKEKKRANKKNTNGLNAFHYFQAILSNIKV